MKPGFFARWQAWVAIVVTPLLFLLQMRVSYPGTYQTDSLDQLNQALTGNFNDWHPPVMAYLWRALIAVTGAPVALYLLQALCYWAGIGLIADALLRIGRRKSGLVILAAGLFPVFLYVNSLLVKDSEMGATLLLSFALVFWFRVQQRRLPLGALLVALLLLGYATLVRANSIFAVGPLLVYFSWRNAAVSISVLRLLLVSLMVSVVALVVSNVVNTRLFEAHRTGPIRSLQIFDIVGIAETSGDLRWVNELAPLDQAWLDRCYTPYWWDSVAPWGTCTELSAKVMNKEFKKITSDRDVYPASAKLHGMWINSISHHPLAYAEHRLKHFNAELNFFVPALERRFAKTWQNDFITAKDVRDDYLKKNAITWPATWFALAILTVICLRRATPGPQTLAATLLATSGLLYGGAYLLIGVAAEARYMYWMILCSAIAVVLGADHIKARLAAGDAAARCGAAAVVAVIVLGMLSRVMDLHWLMR